MRKLISRVLIIPILLMALPLCFLIHIWGIAKAMDERFSKWMDESINYKF